MDERIYEHAELLVNWSARIEAGDQVVLTVSEGAHELAVAVAEVLGEQNAALLATYTSDELTRAYLRGLTRAEGAPTPPTHEQALYETADTLIHLGGGRNTSALSDRPEDTYQSYLDAAEPTRNARRATDWVSTVHPTRSLAQQAGMSIGAYRDFVYQATLRDWEAMAARMAPLKERIDAGRTVQLEGPTIDLTLSIADRTAVNSCGSVAYDSHNLPSGEVFTAPASVDGTILFDVPMTIRGQAVRDVELTFEDGIVTNASAARGQEVLDELLATDAGAKRVGELGIGMNRGIDQQTNNILFDEKMGGTVHLALGRAYDACLPAGETGNDSAIHTDLIADVSSATTMTIDDEIIQRNGTFRWETGFEKTGRGE